VNKFKNVDWLLALSVAAIVLAAVGAARHQVRFGSFVGVPVVVSWETANNDGRNLYAR
jgi:hypothetical protein